MSVSFVTIPADSKPRDIMKDLAKKNLVSASSWLKQSSCSISLNGIPFLQKILYALSRTVTYNSLSFRISVMLISFTQSSIKNSISSSVLLELCRFFLNCAGMDWFLRLVVYRTSPWSVLSGSLIDHWLYWSLTKHDILAWWCIIFARIKSETSPNVSRLVGRCWIRTMASNIFTVFSGNKWTSGTSFYNVFIKALFGKLLVFPLGFASAHGSGPSPYCTLSLISIWRDLWIIVSFENVWQLASTATSFSLTFTFFWTRRPANDFNLFFYIGV